MAFVDVSFEVLIDRPCREVVRAAAGAVGVGPAAPFIPAQVHLAVGTDAPVGVTVPAMVDCVGASALARVEVLEAALALVTLP